MQVPIRLTALLRPSVAPGVLLAVAFSTFVLSATPFLLALVEEEYRVGLTAASLIGVAQLGGFTLGSWGAGMRLRPRRRVFVAALVVALLANLASAALPPFPVLVGLRLASGLSLGMITWFAWVQVFGDDRRMADIAVMGPLSGIVASPLIAAFAVQGGAGAVFALLGGLAALPLLLNRGTGASHQVTPRTDRSRPVPAAAVMLVALGLFTLGGSSVFQYAVVVGTGRVGLSATEVALIFSLNALVGIPAAKWPWRRGVPGPWLGLTGVCAVCSMVVADPVVFGLALVVWGFGFWMAIPGVFSALAERSANPGDRAGDAQALMAGGRVAGPFVGGLVIDGFGEAWLGVIGGGTMLVAAGTVFAVRRLTPPRQPHEAPDARGQADPVEAEPSEADPAERTLRGGGRRSARSG